MPVQAVLATVTNQPGLLSGLTRVLADRQANISYVDIIDHPDRDAQIYLEFSVDAGIDAIAARRRIADAVIDAGKYPL